MSLKVGVWNAEWAKRWTAKGDGVHSILREGGFDIICLTEAYSNLLPEGGHIVTSDPDYGYSITAGRRKVVLWSRNQWKSVDQVGAAEMPGGRFVSGITLTPFGDVQIIGVCIPWRDAHVRTGRGDRQPWEDHATFIRGLDGYLKIPSFQGPRIIVGDFNQRIPRSGTPLDVAESLSRALSGYVVATAGIVQPLGRQMIDHLAHSRELNVNGVIGWPSTRADGLRLSDHDGVSVGLSPEGS